MFRIGSLPIILFFLSGVFISIESHSDHESEVRPALPKSVECERINVPICKYVLRDWAALPNILGHNTQMEVLNSSAYRFLENTTWALYEQQMTVSENETRLNELQRCQIEIQELACRVLTPKCYYMDRLTVSGIPPCSRVCVHVRERCGDILSRSGILWPLFLNCEQMVECHLPSVCLGEREVLRLGRQTRADIFPLVRANLKTHYTYPVMRFRHHDIKGIDSVLTKTIEKCPNIMRLYKIGQSVKRGPIYVVEVSDNPGTHELLEPEVKYIGGIHGNEVLGNELLVQLAQYLCKKWLQKDSYITRLVKTTRIHLLPCLNPDGYALAKKNGGERSRWLDGRYNRYGLDLNRNFPDLTSLVFRNERRGGPNHHIKIPEHYFRRHKVTKVPEIYAIIKWLERIPFVLSGQLHGGELVANYPYDIHRPYGRFSRYSASPDDALFRHLALTYATTHRTMSDPDKNQCEDDFGSQNGITNGAEWYSVYGGMQDFNYLYTNCFEILLELSCIKFIPKSSLFREWLNNRNALLKYIEQAHIGIKGIVTDLTGYPVENGEIQVHGIDHHVTTTSRGEYWRLLLPGNYTVSAVKDGYRTTYNVTIHNNGQEATRQDFTLSFRSKEKNKIHSDTSPTKEDKIIVTYPVDLHAHHENTKDPKALHKSATAISSHKPDITQTSATPVARPHTTHRGITNSVNKKTQHLISKVLQTTTVHTTVAESLNIAQLNVTNEVGEIEGEMVDIIEGSSTADAFLFVLENTQQSNKSAIRPTP